MAFTGANMFSILDDEDGPKPVVARVPVPAPAAKPVAKPVARQADKPGAYFAIDATNVARFNGPCEAHQAEPDGQFDWQQHASREAHTG